MQGKKHKNKINIRFGFGYISRTPRAVVTLLLGRESRDWRGQFIQYPSQGRMYHKGSPGSSLGELVPTPYFYVQTFYRFKFSLPPQYCSAYLFLFPSPIIFIHLLSLITFILFLNPINLLLSLITFILLLSPINYSPLQS